jgi:UDP-N-acetylmuramate--alanine ligase
LNAFVEYCLLLPSNGELIYCADDPGAAEAAKIAEKENRGITLIPYGFSASGDYKIISYNVIDEKAVFRLQGFPGEFTMKIPGRHQALNAAAAIALTVLFVKNEYGCSLVNEKIQSIKTALENFSGSKRRSEILGEAGGIIFMDDYGHHPTAIKTTLAGIKSFYPARRLVCSFMPHTYTRTSALLEEFAGCFTDVDLLFLHKIYASARENYTGGITGKTLYEKTINAAAIIDKKNIFYIDEPEDSFNPLVKILKPGDIFLTLGAGNNWQLGEKLFSYFQD